MTWWKNALATLFDIPGVVKQPDGSFVLYEGKTENEWLQVTCMTCYAPPGQPCSAPRLQAASPGQPVAHRARIDAAPTRTRPL